MEHTSASRARLAPEGAAILAGGLLFGRRPLVRGLLGVHVRQYEDLHEGLRVRRPVAGRVVDGRPIAHGFDHTRVVFP